MSLIRLGIAPSIGRSFTPTPPINAPSISSIMQKSQAAAQTCADSRFNSPALQAACMETMQVADAASLSLAQLYSLVAAKVQCHALADGAGVALDDATMDQCISDPTTFLMNVCAANPSLPACTVAAPGFISKYKKPLLIGGGVLVGLLILKAVL